MLQKSRRRDPRASDFGTYRLIDPEVGGLLWAEVPLEAVERELLRTLSAES